MVFGQHRRGQRLDPFGARTRAYDFFQQQSAEATSLPGVDHRQGDLSRVGAPGIANAACDPDPLGSRSFSATIDSWS